MKVLLVGSTGNTGTLLLHLLQNHPRVRAIDAVSMSREGQEIQEVISTKLIHDHYIGLKDIEDTYDAIFLALPHGVSAEVYQQLFSRFNAHTHTTKDTKPSANHPLIAPSSSETVWIDLSADFRFRDLDSYTEVYGAPAHTHVSYKRAVAQSIYGISELKRNEIASASVIACPGCYPTSILLPLVPVLKHANPTGTITISSVSGVSGAGSSLKPELLFIERSESVKPYSPGRTHRHYFEIAQQIEDTAYRNDVHFTFSPHLAPLSQGILSTIHVPLDNKDIPRAIEALKAQYLGESFIRVYDDLSHIDTRTVRNTNKINIAYQQEHEILILFSTLDNLWKGACGQAIQNFNIRFQCEETEGLNYFSP